MEVMTAEQAAEAGKDLDFAKVWAALMKFDEQQRRTDEQIARSLRGLLIQNVLRLFLDSTDSKSE